MSPRFAIKYVFSERRRGAIDEEMFIIRKKKGESDESLIARFKKKTIAEGVIPELRERERYKKPAEKRKEAKYRVAHQIELEKKRSY